MMIRQAKATLELWRPPLPMRRQALAGPSQIEIDPARLYILVTALHWEQCLPATASERKLYGVTTSYVGNQNGDYFEGGRNVVWECKACGEKFLKYPDKDSCPHCGSTKIWDWEADIFNKHGELLTRNASGNYVFESWVNCPVHENHKEDVEIGRIEDV